ncbi:DUF5025 domain-containing protein [Rufibacter hautae]|uniref:Uncharacterized protein n=1 Tax=Rufibacter hautae TaxID=2595005 RepID=A0A5B6THN3_9BACT|nr:DUF5025 domain-containing protein [Rufibacter hautae]KAA3438764.1 hypothetical protein FOA19_16240 [Rufibacter hautae]
MKLTSTLRFFALAAVLTSCRKDELPPPSLPPATQTGQGTLGFLLRDVEVWSSHGRWCTFTYANCEDNVVTAFYPRSPSRGYELEVSAARTFNSVDQAFGIVVEGITATGTYALEEGKGGKMVFSDYVGPQTEKVYRNSVPNTSTLKVTRLDTIEKVVSGTFSGVLYNTKDPDDSIAVQDGRFDARLKY